MQTFLVDKKFKHKIKEYRWSKNKQGYWRATYNKKNERFLHRLVMEWEGHDIKNKEIDHINRNLNDCRLINLRITTRQIQGFNRGKFKNNSSGYKGVCFKKQTKKWVANIRINKVLIHLGYFKNKKEAYKKYCEKLNEYLSSLS